MSAPGQEQAGGNKPFPPGLWESTFLTRIQDNEISFLDPEIKQIAHSLALDGLRGRLQLPDASLCRAVPYQIVFSPTKIEGGLDLNFARSMGGQRIRTEAARVRAYKFSDGTADITYPFEYPQVVKLFDLSRRIATLFARFHLSLTPDNTSLAGMPPIPITLATHTSQHPPSP